MKNMIELGLEDQDQSGNKWTTAANYYKSSGDNETEASNQSNLNLVRITEVFCQ